MTRPCPCCLNDTFEPLINLGAVPLSRLFLFRPEQPYTCVQLSFEFCTRCALIRRDLFDDQILDYTQVSRTTGHRVAGIPNSNWEWMGQRGVGADELIVEVGANDGAFMDVLAQAGYSNLLGVEPSQPCSAVCRSKGHRVESVYFNGAEANRIKERFGQARVLICRHTLEHVQDPFDLLLAMREVLNEDGILFLEVPDARGIIDALRGHELWDEHLHSFTSENLSVLLQRAGFRIDETRIQWHLGSANILMWCRPASPGVNAPASLSVSAGSVLSCRRYSSCWSKLCKEILEKLPNWPKPIACIGASHLQSNFLLFTGLGHHVNFLVDDDPAKVGRYVPIPEPVPVISTGQLFDGRHPGTIIRGAFGYDDWMDEVVLPLAANGVHVVEPYAVATEVLPKRSLP